MQSSSYWKGNIILQSHPWWSSKPAIGSLFNSIMPEKVHIFQDHAQHEEKKNLKKQQLKCKKTKPGWPKCKQFVRLKYGVKKLYNTDLTKKDKNWKRIRVCAVKDVLLKIAKFVFTLRECTLRKRNTLQATLCSILSSCP